MDYKNEILEIERKELIALIEPLREYLNYNWHPHIKIIVDCNGFELLEGLIASQNNERAI